MARIENHQFTIEEAFRECFYVVPDYQREYIWTEGQITQLLEDIDEQMDSSPSEYFIGTILVSPIDGKKGHSDVIDGQQRLTTIFLILCALRSFFKGMPQVERINDLMATSYTDSQGDIKTSLKLEPRYENAGDVINKIVHANSDPQAVRAEIKSSDINIYGSVKNILNAYDVIYRFLKNNYDGEDKMKKYWGYLANKVVFIQISTEVSNALKIFETINERGVGLNPMDLLKNLLFTQVTPEHFSQLKDEWKKVTSPLEKNNEKPLRFLRYFLMANYDIKNDRKDAVVREDQIYNWFSEKKNAASTGYKEDPFGFVRHITSNVNRYIDFRNDLGNDGGPSLVMASLKKLTGGGFRLHYVLLLAATNLPKPLFDQFVDQIESFLFFYIFTHTPTKELERNFSIWADEVRDIAHIQNSDEQRDNLNKFVNERFAQNMVKKTPELEDTLKRLTLDSMQPYRIRYLLARLTQYVDMAFNGQKDRDSLDPYFRLEIEHILPNNPAEDLLNAWQEKHHGLIYDEITNRLGNLTLLEKPINIVVSNKPYADKIPEYANSAHYLTRSLSALADVGQNTSITRINKKLSSFNKWDAEDIENRQLLLIALVKEIWKISEITA